MPTVLSESDPIWQELTEALKRFISSDERQILAGDGDIHFLKSRSRTSDQKQISEAFKRVRRRLDCILAVRGNDLLGERLVAGGRANWKGRHGEEIADQPKPYPREVSDDPSGPQSAMLAAIACYEYGPVLAALREPQHCIYRLGAQVRSPEEAAKYLTDIFRAEQERGSKSLPPLTKAERRLASIERGAYAGTMKGPAAWDAVYSVDHEVRDLAWIRRHVDAANRAHRHLDDVIARAPDRTRSMLELTDAIWRRRAKWRVLRIFKNSWGTEFEDVIFSDSSQFVSAVDRTCQLMAAHFAIADGHAPLLVFRLGTPPTSSPRVLYRMRSDLPCLSRIVLELDPATLEDTVRDVYRKARSYVLLPTGRPNAKALRQTPRRGGRKGWTLAHHVYGRGLIEIDKPMVNMEQLRLQWNQYLAPQLENQQRNGRRELSEYRYPSKFLADAKAERQRLLFPSYRQIDAENFWIIGDELNAMNDPAIKIEDPGTERETTQSP